MLCMAQTVLNKKALKMQSNSQVKEIAADSTFTEIAAFITLEIVAQRGWTIVSCSIDHRP